MKVQSSAGDARSALVLVDIQPDFLPGGALAIADGDTILEPVDRLLAADPFDVYVATQDWHPPGHVSFASSHGGRQPFDTIELYGHPQTLWPDHCVQGTPGAALSERIDWRRVSAIIRKGSDPDSDSYSGFRNNWNASGERPTTGLAGWLRELDVGHVLLCGLARDFCVKWSAQDAAAAGFRTTVLWDLTRSVDTSSDDAVRGDLEAAGIAVVDSATLGT